jgi:hypothetical protein
MTAAPLTESCTLVAVTVIEAATVIVGAVSTPDEEIAPLDADQITAVLKLPVPVTTTVHGSGTPEASGEAQLGTTEDTLEAGIAGFGVVAIPPPQPAVSAAHRRVSLAVVMLENLSTAICQTQLSLQKRRLSSSTSAAISTLSVSTLFSYSYVIREDGY